MRGFFESWRGGGFDGSATGLGGGKVGEWQMEVYNGSIVAWDEDVGGCLRVGEPSSIAMGRQGPATGTIYLMVTSSSTIRVRSDI